MLGRYFCVLRHLGDLQGRVGKVETGLDGEKAFRNEIRGAVRMLRAFSAFITVVAALMAIGWYIALIAGAKL